MSFRLFIYYCAACGGCGALLGWTLALLLSSTDDKSLAAGITGLLLGIGVALALSIIDTIGGGSARQVGNLLGRAAVAVAIGAAGGFLGGYLGDLLNAATDLDLFVVIGWILTGLLIGCAPAAFDFLFTLGGGDAARGPRRKLFRGLIGGGIGGLLGALLFLFLRDNLFASKEGAFWSPSAAGFVALGVCIGLMMALAQVILREAWLRVEAGFRPGRELLLSRAETTVGRAESCDLGLFGDPTVERLHARIVQQGDRYYLVDAGSTAGTFVNGQRVQGSTPLRSGDEIRLGRNLLRFGERQKRPT